MKFSVQSFCDCMVLFCCLVPTKQNDTPYIKGLLRRFLNVAENMFPKFGIDVVFPW